ncbi:type VII secretion-associated serine protease mycosin [Kitasatospora sp. NPDC048538]|uniref:type VII secretion-associated serine protease mycosin n=1 Tax=unclassified Kitasatospora TaxID=2633591 RepID=UPI0033E903FF
MTRAVAALAVGALTWGVPAASADQIRDEQWALRTFEAEAKVWTISQGEGVLVGLVDSGVDQDHQDLTGQVLPGVDFSGGNTDGRVDSDGHGTAMASLIAGHGHGAQAGVLGLAPKAKILPVKVDTSSGRSDVQQNGLAQGIRFAVDHGAKVVNMSVGGASRFDSQSRAAVEYAISKDVVLVAAAGNSGDDRQGVQYPAAFPGVVAVAAVDSAGAVWDRSTRGVETTLAAPGVDIYQATAKSTASYGVGNGTSDATAYVSATAALIRARFPGLSAGQVINRMIKSASPPVDGSAVPNDRYGYGVVSPARALAVDPAVDGGARENPLVGRRESQGAAPEAAAGPPGDEAVVPAAEAGGGGGGWFGAGVAVGVALWGVLLGGVMSVVLLVVRARRRRRSAGGSSGVR